MSETKHTSGPWKLELGQFNFEGDEGNANCIGSITDQHGYFIAKVENTGRDEANSRLIAAAPDLLSACKDMNVFFGSMAGACEREAEDAILLCRSAIAKAEGRS